MSDHLENWIQQNRESFDTIEPKSELWDKIQSNLPDPPQPPSEGGQPGSGAGGGGGFASSGLVKWALGLATAAVVGTAAWFALDGGEEAHRPATVLDPGTETEIVAENSVVRPPVPGVNVPYAHFEVNTGTGGEFSYPSGTVIGVPEQAFVDADGNPVDGPVDLRYREFHDGSQILFSGIPMVHTDKNGVAHDFQTAGMNEIRAFKNGEEVFLAPGKNLQVKMASYTGEDDHKLWKLNEQTGNWEDRGMAELQPNAQVQQALAALPKVPAEPTRPAQVGESENILEFDVDYSEFPHLASYKKILWEYLDPARIEQNMWVFGEAWSQTELTEHPDGEGVYTLSLKNKRRNFDVKVRPVLEGEEYAAALARYKSAKAEHDRIKEEVRKEREALAAQAEFFRIFEVPSTGIFNCDRYLARANQTNLVAKVKFDDNVSIDPERMTLYLITGSNRACISYKGAELNSMRWWQRERNALVTIIPGPKYAVFTPEEFAKLDYKKISKAGEHTFHLRTLEQEIGDPDDLRLALGM